MYGRGDRRTRHMRPAVFDTAYTAGDAYSSASKCVADGSQLPCAALEAREVQSLHLGLPSACALNPLTREHMVSSARESNRCQHPVNSSVAAERRDNYTSPLSPPPLQPPPLHRAAVDRQVTMLTQRKGAGRCAAGWGKRTSRELGDPCRQRGYRCPPPTSLSLPSSFSW